MSGGTNSEPGTGVRSSSSVDEISSGQRCQSGEIAEWRSCDQVENGIATTSPPYWDTDDDDCIGPKPSELFGKFTWRIENFNQISKRELRSNVFEVGGYKWYILIYPQGCEVTNHLSLFLCVANHEKLLPGWSHFAQFTISVVNKDPKKSKYSGQHTLHRFWKKEHDWGWKKFMELSKVKEGFVVNENLVIKAQVQVIREKTQSPFRCLDCQYRRELIRVYVSNVEQICRRFVEERKGKLNKLIKDKARWLSFRHFWIGVDEKSRHCMLTDKTEAILKVVVKHFFIEKEVTSTLVMDSIYSGLRALENQSKTNKGREKSVEIEETIVPMVFIEKDMFVLEDDLLVLLERAALESMPPKEDKGTQNQNVNQNRTKDGNSSEDSNKDSIDRDERRLTELGRRTVEIFVLAHIFSSKIEVAYQEAIALKRQEELIREEEWQAEELKAKRGPADKDKKSKKKQTKQKRSNRKGKEKVRDIKSDVILPVKQNQNKRSPSVERPLEKHLIETATKIVEKVEITEDASDVSDTGDDAIEIQHDIEDIDGSPSNCDTDASEVPPLTEFRSEVQNEPVEKEIPLVIDDSSSTCSTDSVPSVGLNGQYKGNVSQGRKCPASPIRGKHQYGNATQNQKIQARETDGAPSDIATDPDCLQDSADVCGPIALESGSLISLNDHAPVPEHLIDKEEVSTLQKKIGGKSIVDIKKSTKLKTFETASARKVGIERPTVPIKSEISSAIATPPKLIQPSSLIQQSIHTRESSSNSSQHDKAQNTYIVKPEVQNQKSSPNTYKVSAVKLPSSMSRPSTAPLFPGPKATAPLVSTVQTMTLLRSVSASEPLASTHVYGPQSYRNAIIGKNSMGPISSGSIPCPSITSSTQSGIHSPPTTVFMTSPSTASLQSSSNTDKISMLSGFGFRPVIPDTLSGGSQQCEGVLVSDAASSRMLHSNIINHTARLNIHEGASLKREVGSSISSQQSQGSNSYEFPHIDMINYLLDEDQVVEEEIKTNGQDQLRMNRHQYTFPGSMSFSDRGLSNGSSQYEGPGQFYDDAMQRSLYRSSSNVHYDVRMDPTVYANGHIVDPSVHGMDPSDIHRYHSYQLPDYSSTTRSFNGYNVYRPANGS